MRTGSARTPARGRARGAPQPRCRGPRGLRRRRSRRRRGARARGRARAGRTGRRGSRAGATRAGRASAGSRPETARSPSPRPAPEGSGAAGPSRGSRSGERWGRGNAPAQTEANLTRRDSGSLHVRRPAGGHRQAFRAAGATTIAADANRLAPALYSRTPSSSSRAWTTPATSRRSATLVERHDVKLIVPLTDLDQRLLARARDSSHALVLLPEADVVERLRRQVARARPASRSAGSPRRPRGCRQRCRPTCASPCSSRRATASGRATSTAARTRASSSSSSATRPSSRACSSSASARSSRSTSSATRRPLPERDPAHDDRVEGRRVDQGQTIKDWQLIEFGRRVAETLDLVGPANIQCFRERTARTRSPTSIPASAAGSRCRRPPGAATRSSRSPSRAASGPSRAWASSARAS